MSHFGIAHLPMTLTLVPQQSDSEVADHTASLNEVVSGWTATTLGALALLRAEDIDLRLYIDLDEARAQFDAFARESDQMAFQNFEWLSAWDRHIGRTQGVAPLLVVGADRDGTPLLMLALGIETRGLARRLTWLGTDQCDYNGPTLHKRFAERFTANDFAALWARIITLLQTESGHTFDIVDLAKMPETIGEQPNPFLALPTAPNPSGAYITSLGNDWDAFYTEKRSSQTRKKERRQLKHLAEFGAVQFVDVQATDERKRTLELLFQQKSRALARMGAEDIFASPERRAFYLDMATSDTMRDLVHVSRLDIGGAGAAVSVGLRADGRYYLILTSYDDGEASKHGPGRALLHELLRYAIANRFRYFDFTIGDEPYKMDWSDSRLVLHDHLSATTLRGLAAVKALTAFRALKRTIKQNPTMWLAFSKARAAAGNLFSR
jgi:CelD/BcsL family acetyltransferase involved in cellulose biosynthesis